MKTLLTFFCLLITNLLHAQEYTTALMAAKMDLDSAWAQNTAPAADKICLPQKAHLMRNKQLSDHQCIENAIIAAKTNGVEDALSWLIASQCYNPPAQDRVSKAGADAVRYVMNMWGGGQDKIASGPADAVSTETVVLDLSFVNHTGDWLYVYELESDLPDGKADCSEFRYVTKVATNRHFLRKVPKGKYSWLRFSRVQGKDGCVDVIKEYKVGPAPDQQTTASQQIEIQ